MASTIAQRADPDNMSSTIGFLGAGQMGAGMVQCLLKRGHRVIVWSRTPARHRALEESGAELSASIADTTRESDIVLGCLRNTDVTHECYLGNAGVLASSRPGQIIVEHGTFDPALAVEIAANATLRECRFLDAPVTGGPDRARSGELVTMVGGEQGAFDTVRETLGAYCRQVVHVGVSGTGSRLKLINQLLVSIHVVAAAEASALVLREGIDPVIAHAVLMGGWAASAMLDRGLPRACAGDFLGSGATVEKLVEVQPLISELLRSAGVESQLFGPARAMFDATALAGGADFDLSAIVMRYAQNAQNAQFAQSARSLIA